MRACVRVRACACVIVVHGLAGPSHARVALEEEEQSCGGIMCATG